MSSASCGRSQSWLAIDRKRAHSDAAPLDHDNASAQQRIRDRRKVGQHQCKLAVWPAVGSSAQKKNRRLSLASQRKQRAKVGVGRNENPAFLRGQSEYYVVVGCLQAKVAHMDSVVAVLPQALRDHRR